MAFGVKVPKSDSITRSKFFISFYERELVFNIYTPKPATKHWKIVACIFQCIANCHTTYKHIYFTQFFEFIGVLRHMQQYFSHICDDMDVQADWRRNTTYGRAPNAIDIS